MSVGAEVTFRPPNDDIDSVRSITLFSLTRIAGERFIAEAGELKSMERPRLLDSGGAAVAISRRECR